MESLIAAVFYAIVMMPGKPPIQLEAPMPLDECLAEEAAFLSKPHPIFEAHGGGRLQAGCVVDVVPFIEH